MDTFNGSIESLKNGARTMPELTLYIINTVVFTRVNRGCRQAMS